MRTWFSFRFWLGAMIFVALNGVAANAQEATVKLASKKAGKFEITVRVPQGGLFSQEEQLIELRVVDAGGENQPEKPQPIVNAAIGVPSMPSMPRIREMAQAGGVPGEFRLHPTFADGGDYLLVLNVQPRGEPAFSVEFPIEVKDSESRSKGGPGQRPYSMEVVTDPGVVISGQPVTLKFKVFANREGRRMDGQFTGTREAIQLSEFEVAHERKMHLTIVRKDLGVYAQEQAILQRDGSFILKNFRFPASGEFRIFAEVVPREAGRQVLAGVVNVTGKDKPSSVPLKITTEQRSDGILVNPVGSLTIPAGKTSLVSFELRDQFAGGPVLDLQPYLGAMGHLVMVHQDGTTHVHAYPDERDAKAGKNGRLTFLVRPPKPGLYRGWFDFQHSGKLTRVDFVFTVKASR